MTPSNVPDGVAAATMGRDMSVRPSPNGRNGARDGRGRFAKGNPGGPGNPFARRVARIKSLIVDAVSDDDLRAVVAMLVERAKGGDVAAAREILNRLVGRPAAATDPEQRELEERRLELRDRQVEATEGRLLLRI